MEKLGVSSKEYMAFSIPSAQVVGCYFVAKRNRGFLEKWLIPGLQQDMHITHVIGLGYTLLECEEMNKG